MKIANYVIEGGLGIVFEFSHRHEAYVSVSSMNKIIDLEFRDAMDMEEENTAIRNTKLLLTVNKPSKKDNILNLIY